MEIRNFIATFTSELAAENFAATIEENFSFLIKGNSIQVNARKNNKTNSKRSLFEVDAFSLTRVANTCGGLVRASY